MSRFLDSSELREASELLSEIYRPKSAGDTKMSVASEEGQTPIKRSNELFEKVGSDVTTDETTSAGAASMSLISEAEAKEQTIPSEKRSVSLPIRQNSEELTVSDENRTRPDTTIPEPEPERPTPFAAILANQQSLKKKLEQSSPFRAFQTGSSEITESKSANDTASDNAKSGAVTAAWLEKARNEINDLDRGTEIRESKLSAVGSENTTTAEDEKGIATVSVFEKQNDLSAASPFGTNKESNSVRSETLPKKPVWPWEKNEEKPKPIIAIPEAKSNSTTESGIEKKNPVWPWKQK